MSENNLASAAGVISSSVDRAEIGVIGGSGFYAFLEGAHAVPIATPFGAPSEPPQVGEVAGRRVAFIPRHGRDHQFPPHQSTTGPTCGLYGRSESARFSAPAPSALRVEWGPGTLVVPDQIIDRTWGRRHTVFSEVGPVVHIPFADPYCPRGRSVSSAEAARSVGRLNLVEPWP